MDCATIKKCTCCDLEKNIDQYYKGRNQCKQCRIAITRNYALKYDKEKIKERHRKFYKKHVEKLREKAKLYRENHKEQRSAYQKIYCQLNKSKINLRQANRKIRDIKVRIACSLRTRVRNALNGTSKSRSTFELIGCTGEELYLYIESKFKDGMSWENYGHKGWHIDHIIPCISFDLSDPDEQKKCFNFNNLQPLWAKDNLKKGKNLI